MLKGKYLTLDERQTIQLGLNENLRFKQIADNIGKDPSTISKEVQNHITTKLTIKFNPCANLKEYTHYRALCSPCYSAYGGQCRNCNRLECFSKCKDFIPKHCKNCFRHLMYAMAVKTIEVAAHLQRHLYDELSEQKAYIEKLSKYRQGFAISSDELKRLDEIVSHLIN